MYQEWFKKFEKLRKENCKYCMNGNKETINGEEFDLLSTAGFNNDRKYSSWILKGKNDRKAGIIILTNYTNGVYFNINYCPMCGRRIGD